MNLLPLTLLLSEYFTIAVGKERKTATQQIIGQTGPQCETLWLSGFSGKSISQNQSVYNNFPIDLMENARDVRKL